MLNWSFIKINQTPGNSKLGACYLDIQFDVCCVNGGGGCGGGILLQSFINWFRLQMCVCGL